MIDSSAERLALQAAVIVLVTCLLSSCTAPQSSRSHDRRYAVHTFSFDARRDSPDVSILDFHYAGNDHPSLRGCPRLPDECKPPFGATVAHGRMEVGEHLYVKWKVKATGDIYEDMVDLRDRLPRDMENKRVYFLVHRGRLYVFLIDAPGPIPRRCPPFLVLADLSEFGDPHDKVFSQFCYLQFRSIYPKAPWDLPMKVEP